MQFLTALLLGIGLSADAFAVAVCKGLAMKKANLSSALTVGLWFGGFQALMPLAGYFLGTRFYALIEGFDHFVAFGLLALIGLNMIREAVFPGKEETTDEKSASLGFLNMLVLAVATSIDALAVGIALAMDPATDIWLSVATIGITTFLLSAAGLFIGNLFGSRFEKKAQIAGGIILVLLGAKILLEHLLP